MILKDIIYTLWRELEGGYIPDDTRYTYKNIRTVVVGCVAEPATQMGMQLRNADADNPYPSYHIQYEREVVRDSRQGINYINLSGRSISFNSKRNYDVTPGTDSYHLYSTDFLPTTPQEWFSLKRLPRVPDVAHYIITPDRLNFLSGVEVGDTLIISQSFSIPTDGDEKSDADAQIPEEIGRAVMVNSLTILRDQLRPSDRANDGVPSQI